MIFSALYLLTCRLLGSLMVLARHEVSKDAELLVLRHQNAVLRRQIGRVRYRPTDRLWLAALSRLIPRQRWGEVFAVTPGTLLAWHRRLVTRKWDYSSRRRPGRPVHGSRDPQARHPHRDGQSDVGHRRVQGELVKLGHRIGYGILVKLIRHGAVPRGGSGRLVAAGRARRAPRPRARPARWRARRGRWPLARRRWRH